ncbi:RNA-binding transcriptional accessory protein [Fusibacter sp. A1]|nr:RNA-binding transcriptional accessory protein [Fusibacter sp. A1]
MFEQIAKELNIGIGQVEKTVELIDEGNTIPFIARYRKEVTGKLTDTQLRELGDRLTYLRSLEDRKSEVTRHITELEQMTPELERAISKAEKLSELEDIYRPFKPKRRTKATIAKEKGLEPLSNILLLLSDEVKIRHEAERLIDEEKGINTAEDAIAGAMDIVAEHISDMASVRDAFRKIYEREAMIVTAVSKSGDEAATYTMYHDYQENAMKMPPHRILAVNRGERENILKVKMDLDHDKAVEMVGSGVLKDMLKNQFVNSAFTDAYKRLISPALERELRSAMTERAEEHAIGIFGVNLKQLLMSPPLRGKVVMGFDPAYRTGCKISVMDELGKVLEYTTIFPTKPQMDIEKSAKIMKQFIEKHKVDLIAIGNGTGSRESEQFVADVIKSIDREVHYMIVNEAGASVYSASQLASDEYPDIDVSIRGAISIGARVQDPLSELVKIDPKSIGVGQYQHDVNQKRLTEVLDGVVEDAVNSVGVDINTASESLLRHIAGISKTTAKNLVSYRYDKGEFKTRKEVLKVKGIGQAAFNQAAGFLRLPTGKEALDRTGVHPESYEVCKKLMEILKIDPKMIGVEAPNAQGLANLYGMRKLKEELDIHMILLEDLLKELDKPGRDPREDMAPPILRSDVLTIDDLTDGMELQGTVRNVVDFGAFVDIGVKQDGLVHISELANRFIKKPMDVVSVGDIVTVRVIGIDVKRQKVALSMKQVGK